MRWIKNSAIRVVRRLLSIERKVLLGDPSASVPLGVMEADSFCESFNQRFPAGKGELLLRRWVPVEDPDNGRPIGD